MNNLKVSSNFMKILGLVIDTFLHLLKYNFIFESKYKMENGKPDFTVMGLAYKS
jgi:hypothetical protein